MGKLKEAKNIFHFSQTKCTWILIKKMNPVYMVNVVSNILENHTAKQALELPEFQSLILNLAKKIKQDIERKEITERIQQ